MPDTPTIPHSAEDVRVSREWADFYRFKGYNPVPSRPEEKRPFVRWSQWLDRVVPAETFDRFGTANIQVMTGRRWGLVVIDLDGPEAIGHWPSMGPTCPRTWVTHSGGHGRHLWFSVGPDGPPIASGRLWGLWEPDAREGRGDWARHKAVEVLGDRKLVMAPPSIHPRTGRKYRFLGGCSPREVARPAPAPRWVLDLPTIAAPRPTPAPSPDAPRIARAARQGVRHDRTSVLSSIPDKAAVAQSWGLRFASLRPNASGWCPVHAIGRDDRTPSASFRPSTGHYWDHERGTISLFDLGVEQGAYRDWREAVDDLGERFHAPTLAYTHTHTRGGDSLRVMEFNSIQHEGEFKTLRANVGAPACSQHGEVRP